MRTRCAIATGVNAGHVHVLTVIDERQLTQGGERSRNGRRTTAGGCFLRARLDSDQAGDMSRGGRAPGLGHAEGPLVAGTRKRGARKDNRDEFHVDCHVGHPFPVSSAIWPEDM